MKLTRDFELEVFYGRWEFCVDYNISSTDMQSMTVRELLETAGRDPEELLDLRLGYTETWGRPELREAIAARFARLEAEDVLCFSASEESIFCLMNALLDEEDHAVVVVPAYQSAETIPMSRCRTTAVVLDRSQGWSLDLQRLEDAVGPSTRLVYVNFPNNPTGALLSGDELAAVVEICRRREAWLVSDEIFRGSERDEERRLPRVADLYERGFSLSGTSKMYGLPGLRIGWIASRDREALRRIERYKHFTTICSSGPSEMLATIAIEAEDALFRRTRELKGLYLEEFERFFSDHTECFAWTPPDSGLCGYPRYVGPGSAENLCSELLSSQGVLLVPGVLFRSDLVDLPTDHVRVGFTRPETREALQRVDEFLRSRRG